MSADLDTLREQIQSYLDAEGFVVFHASSRGQENLPALYWDTARYPDYQLFLQGAKQVGVALIAIHHRELEADLVEDALVDLENTEMPHEELVRVRQRLQELHVWEGFTSVVELSYLHQGQVYVYSRRAEWYDEILELTEEIDDYLTEGLDDEDPSSGMGGYFSRN